MYEYCSRKFGHYLSITGFDKVYYGFSAAGTIERGSGQ